MTVGGIRLAPGTVQRSTVRMYGAGSTTVAPPTTLRPATSTTRSPPTTATSTTTATTPGGSPSSTIAATAPAPQPTAGRSRC